MIFSKRYNRAGLMFAVILALSAMQPMMAQAQDGNEKLSADQIRKQLRQCEAHMQVNQLLTGRGGNAMACYHVVLQSDAGNRRALAGITAIEDKYIAWIRRELARQHIARAALYLRKLKMINEEREEVAELAWRIAKVNRQLVGKLVAIPGGSFRMGDLSGNGDEQPVHSVRIAAFQMGAHELTVAQFRAFIKDSGYDMGNECWIQEGGEWKQHSGRNWRSPGFAQVDTHPVVCVNYADALAFIDWLNKKTGGGYRLPTEAEWEYAARSGTASEYSWGDSAHQADSYAWYSDNSGGRTHVVGGRRANAWGLYDMHGNVWEWVRDKYDADYYANSPASDPQDSDSGEARVNRGGSWNYSAEYLRSANRDGSAPSYRVYSLGFRLVRP